MDKAELGAWLRLTLTHGVGNVAARKLLGALGPPEQIYIQARAVLEQLVSPAQAGALLQEPEALPDLLEQTWAWLSAPDQGPVQRQVVTLGDPLYPRELLSIEDPPIVLYVMGQLSAFAERASAALAIVGSRNPTAQGLTNARQFAQACAQAGLVVVSGLALGIDGSAHEGALDAQAQPGACATIAVVGTGLDRVYPKRHLKLAHRIALSGVLLSEYPIGTPPLAENFPKRNRLISGLSLGTLVVEAALQSGSLITATQALEQGREVFAIPGSIHSPLSRGCHALIRQGAKLVESAQDILEELRLPGHALAPAGTSPEPVPETDLLRQLGHDPVHLDVLLARTGLDAATLQVQLLELELEGAVARLPGGLFQRCALS